MQDLPIHGHKGHGVVALQLIPAVEIHWPSTLACAPVPTAGLNAKDKFYVLMQVGGPVIPSLRMLGLARACMQIEDLGEKVGREQKTAYNDNLEKINGTRKNIEGITEEFFFSKIRRS